MHLHNEATALEAEAATWKLLVHLYAQTSKVYPAGLGGQMTALPTVSRLPYCCLNVRDTGNTGHAHAAKHHSSSHIG